MPIDIKTDVQLLERLRASAHNEMSKERLHKQRVSFIWGALPSDSPITRAQIETALARLEGELA